MATILYVQCKECGHQQSFSKHDYEEATCESCRSNRLELVEENSITAKLSAELKGLIP